jgi:hypothetical protein
MKRAPSVLRIVGRFVPPDVTAIAPGRGNDDARFDGDLVGVGLDGNFGGLVGVGQPNLDLLPADP